MPPQKIFSMNNALKIDLAEYDYSGEGANGASYNHKSDPRFMLKLYNNTKPLSFITSELERAQKVYDLGIPSPKPGVLVTDGERYGIRFERILNKKSFSRAVGDNPAQVDYYAKEFAKLCKQLHSTVCPKDQFINVKDAYKRDLAENEFFTADEKAKIINFIDATPDGDTAIHGDLQFSNAITDGEHNYFIDLGDFAYGNPLFDLGMVLLCCKYDSDEFVEEVFHMSNATAHKFWDAFAPAYFGADTDMAEIEQKIRPYAGLKTIIIERDAHMPFPEFRALMDGIL